MENVEREKDPVKAKKMQEALRRFHQQYDGEESNDEDQDGPEGTDISIKWHGMDMDIVLLLLISSFHYF